jgi:allantoate deiminase
MPVAMLFVRCEGGISHHPSENVNEADVAAALDTGIAFLGELERSRRG